MSKALRRLLWRDVTDRSDCTCIYDDENGHVVDRCALCEACIELGFGAYQGPDWLAERLTESASNTAEPPTDPQHLKDECPAVDDGRAWAEDIHHRTMVWATREWRRRYPIDDGLYVVWIR
jgi:hypothetical protein